MKKQLSFDQGTLILWSKRLLVYLVGLFCMAVGVVFSVRSALGVSPVTCLANVVYQITQSDLGVCTTAVYCLYILVEFIILRRDFKPKMLLQIAASFLFGSLVSLATSLFSFLPMPTSYPMQLLYLACSIPLVATGVMLYLAPNILPTPGEGMSLAISMKTGFPVATSKMIFDCTMVVVSTVVSLIYFHGLVGVREGTVISAFLVGFVMRRLMRVFETRLLHFVGRESKRAEYESQIPLDRSGKPKIMVTVSREFGSGGQEIAEKLAEKLGIAFYDQELIPLEVEESGMSEEFVRRHEYSLSHEVLSDFFNSGYAMYHEGMSPLERLFAAQTAVIRRLADSDESCVIVGRCASYILYHDPNSFRVFVHANPEDRCTRLMERQGMTKAAAHRNMEQTDRARAWVYKQSTGRQWGDGRYFNLAVDSGKLGIDGSVELISEAIRLWCIERGMEPISK